MPNQSSPGDIVRTKVNMTWCDGIQFPAGSNAIIVLPAVSLSGNTDVDSADSEPGRLSIDGHELTYWSHEVEAI
jgi:hypothetical protein